jgi:Protein of unknown function (DUF3604)
MASATDAKRRRPPPGSRASPWAVWWHYVRVIEIPTPRWTAYGAKYYGVDMAAQVPMTVQDRAYTSPIWYTPAG